MQVPLYNMTKAESRLTDLARRIAEQHGRRCLGLNDGYSKTLYVYKTFGVNGWAYMIYTSDGGNGFILGRTVADARRSLSEIRETATTSL